MTQDFVPFGLTEEEALQRRVLVDGIPKWMYSSVHAWIAQRISYGTRGSLANLVTVREIETACAIDLEAPAIVAMAPLTSVMKVIVNLSDVTVLRIVDYLLWQTTYLRADHVKKMDVILQRGLSKWQVGEVDGRPRLIERVPAGVQDAAEAIIAAKSTAGTLLGEAWAKVHRFEPDDSGAYSYAVRAVEAASFRALGINDKEATLGNTIRMIEGGTWGLPFKREHNKAPSQDVLVGMLRTLFRGQRDRHGSEDYSDVDHDEAVAAVNLAVALVGWFASGAVQRREA